MSYISQIIITALASLLALTVHEFAHGYASYKLGDPTARALGRLTLNPIRHLDPIGAICLVFFHFGWAKPVPIDPRYFKRPKRDFSIVALAGPLTNLILSFLSALGFLLLLRAYYTIDFRAVIVENFFFNLVYFMSAFHIVNLGLAIFNLIPVPPLDGSRLLNVILPTRLYFKVMEYERYIYFGLIGWLLLGDFVKTALLSVPGIAESSVLSTVAGIFSLSDMLGALISFISDKFIAFWQLIPFINY